MKVAVVGCGYLGAVHAACMASLGHDVIGVDTDERKIAQLRQGDAPFYEPALEDLLRDGLSSGRLAFSTDIAAVSESDVVFIAVGTPQMKTGTAADISYLDGAVDSLTPHLRPGSVVVGKSTVPVGTAHRIATKLSQSNPDVVLVWNPEFLRESHAIADTLHPDRFVYGVPAGVSGDRGAAVLDTVYAEILNAGTPKIVTDYATAELVKVAANAFLATKISFINAMAEIAEVTGADVTQLADALGHDARIGRRFLNSGLGFGGGCLPKDIRGFHARAEELGVGKSLAFLTEVDAVNMRRRARMVDLTRETLGGSLKGKKLAVLGLAFKPNSDDIRDSPALDVADRLVREGADVIGTDPKAVPNARTSYPQLRFVERVAEAVKGADAVLVLTEWEEYRQLSPDSLASVKGKIVLDGRNCLDRTMWVEAGWQFRSLGRGTAS